MDPLLIRTRVAFVVGATLGLAACGTHSSAASEARRFLAAVRLPTASHQVSTAPIPQLQSSATKLLCFYHGGAGTSTAITDDEYRLWLVQASLEATKSVILGHRPTGFDLNRIALGPITVERPSAGISFVESGGRFSQLYLTLVQLSPLSVAVRADAISVPAGAVCGGSQPNRTVPAG